MSHAAEQRTQPLKSLNKGRKNLFSTNSLTALRDLVLQEILLRLIDNYHPCVDTATNADPLEYGFTSTEPYLANNSVTWKINIDPSLLVKT